MKRAERIEKAAKALLDATIEDAGDGSEFPDDDGGVAIWTGGGESAVTFKHIRDLRSALDAPNTDGESE